MEHPVTSLPEISQGSFYEKLVASIIALEGFLAELRTASDRGEMLAMTLRHLKGLLPLRTAGIFSPREADLSFKLETALEAEAARELNRLVEESIDAGVFGWALHHHRPAAYRRRENEPALILVALRTRQRVMGMFAGILSTSSAMGWDAYMAILTTHLACAADAILSEELTLELQEHNRHLDSLVQQRTRQLLEAKEAAELANRAKGKFLATVSHELRTPLTAILGYTQILATDEPVTSSQGHHLQTIRKSAEHLLSLINDLLDMSKAESTRLEVAPARVELRPLIQEVINAIEPLARKKALGFDCTIESRIPSTLTTDPRRIRQVLLNLLSNAIKFTQRGGVSLRVTPQAGGVRLEVRDTGRGLAESDLPKLFQPFQRLESATDAPAEGTGLGLYICRTILQALGSEINVKSEVGRGSCFWFDLAGEADGTELLVAETLIRSRPEASIGGVAAGVLTREQLGRLRVLAGKGDILELQQELERLMAAAAGGESSLVKALHSLARDCKINAIREALAQHERDHPDC